MSTMTSEMTSYTLSDEFNSSTPEYQDLENLSDISPITSSSTVLHSINSPSDHIIPGLPSPPSSESPSQTTPSEMNNFQQYHQFEGQSPTYRFHDESHEHGPNGSTRPKRRQVKNACTNCQKACKKCDDARPCLRCVKYGVGDGCVNSQRKERRKGIKRGPYKKRDGKSSADSADGRGDYPRQRYGAELMPMMTGMPMPSYGAYALSSVPYPGGPFFIQSASASTVAGQQAYPPGASLRAGEFPAIHFAPFYPHLPHYPVMHHPAYMIASTPYPPDPTSGPSPPQSPVDHGPTKK